MNMEPSEIRCTKDDEFQYAPCNCPECLKEQEGRIAAFNAPTILTDENILNEGKYETWIGPVFKCPNCGSDSIMPPAKCCAVCMKPVEYQSHILTEIIKKIQTP